MCRRPLCRISYRRTKNAITLKCVLVPSGILLKILSLREAAHNHSCLGLCRDPRAGHASPGGRTPVIPPPPLAILGEPVTTTYVVDSMMVVLTKRKTSKPSTWSQGTVVTLGWKGCFIATGGCPPVVLMEVLVRVGTPVCVRGRGKAWGALTGPQKITQGVSVSPGVARPHGGVSPLLGGSCAWVDPAISSL